MLTMRIANFLERHGVQPEQVLALTFTKKACEEMQERVAKLCPSIAAHALCVKTFHAFCREIVRSHYQWLNLSREPDTLDAVAQAELIKECIEAMSPSKMQEVRAWKPDQKSDGLDDLEGGSISEDRSTRLFQGQAKGLHSSIKYFVDWLRKRRSASRATGVGYGSEAGQVMQDDRDDLGGVGGRWHPGAGGGGGPCLEAQSTEEELKAAYDRAKRQRVQVNFDMYNHTIKIIYNNHNMYRSCDESEREGGFRRYDAAHPQSFAARLVGGKQAQEPLPVHLCR